ncbi:MAG: alpha/beta hydrolase [Acidiferrobacteraceae bacterium]|jgi:pimeloyl-ACP methyl ester carboxylesterase|nr:alpha/beta hydrolase [Acidiferrobacteraceae bacterium]HJP07139.1 alpha/beta fold hydrolase [Arenicellales bacterium]|tara:strand:- start:1323 stop:2126 length:804 start_codon:yes stop_codon:yes gene_type:complete
MTAEGTCSFSITGQGPPLFLIHGIGASRQTWDKAMPALAAHFTVVTYDLRGHGQSPLPVNRLTLDRLVEDLEQVRRQSGFEQAHFAGHSLGGMIGPAYALNYPHRVLSVGLLSTAAFRTPDDLAKVGAVVSAMEKDGIAQVLPTLTDRWFTDDFICDYPGVVEQRLQQVLDTDPEVFLNVFQIYATTEMASWLHKVTAPCLVLTGENDGGCNPRLNRQIDTALADSELVILPGYKHSLLLEAGEIVADHLIRFICSLDTRTESGTDC